MRRVLVGTFLFEGVGAALLSIRFVQQFGPLRGVGMGVFHAVSAFCNGGFDLMGTPDDPFCSLVHYAEDPLVSLTIMALIVLGGLGFFVWSDVGITGASAASACTASSYSPCRASCSAAAFC